MAMLLEFEKKVADFIKANRLFDSADKILLAISGGADSTALLYTIRALKAGKMLSADIICAHINHQLRGIDADLDEVFVTERARDLKLTVTTRRLDVRDFARKNKMSIETAARQLRMEALLDIAKAGKCNFIATAHHKNDNAETVLHRLVRGTGFRGLAGIWPTRFLDDNIRLVRPLLSVTRDGIIDYLRIRNLKWRQDHTNADCTYTRNFIRHRLLPELQKDCNGSIVEQLSALSASARRFYSLVCNCTDKAWPKLADCSDNMIKLNLQMFLTQPAAVKIELIRRSLAAIGSGQRDLTRRHFKRILQLAQQNVGGRKIELPVGFVVRREYDYLVFTRSEKSSTPNELISKSIKVQTPGQTEFGQYLIEAAVLDTQGSMLDIREKTKSRIRLVECFDLDKVKLPLEVRFRKPGDRFQPLGLTAEKKIGKFLTAAKVPRQLRRRLLVVTDSEKIIWLWPIRISEQAKITGETQRILQLQITDTDRQK
jgi:tRNA(Ile)-lysidine synthase